jgi:hypothetical protein
VFRIVLLAFIVLLGGCSFESLSALNEVDKVQLVKRNTSMKLYRAYFVRTNLKPVRKHQKYLFFYNKKREELAILLHSGWRYKLYSITYPHKVITTVNANKKKKYRYVISTLARKGYHQVSLSQIGFTSRTAMRRYKGFKTLMVEVRDYRHLLHIYQKAIRNYDASLIKSVKGRIPRNLISSYLHRYEKKANTVEHREQLRIISSQLNIGNGHMETLPFPKERRAKKRDNTIYHYYRDKTSYEKLDNYLSGKESEYALSYKERKVLLAKHRTLKKEWLLQHGSLEELISAYKSNRDPRYKSRIMILMKKVQESEKSPT